MHQEEELLHLLAGNLRHAEAAREKKKQRKRLTFDTLQEDFIIALRGWDVPTCLLSLGICRHTVTPHVRQKRRVFQLQI